MQRPATQAPSGRAAKPRHSRRTAALALLLSAVATACAPVEHDGTTVTDSAGVALVTTGLAREPLPWLADTVRVFGGDDTGATAFYRVRRNLIDVDARGRILVLDPNAHHVVAFDSTGRALAIAGHHGEGPGELMFPLSVTAGENTDAYVHDGRGRLVRLWLGGADPEGEGGGGVHEPTDAPFPYGVIHVALRQVEATPAGLLVWARRPAATLDDRTLGLLSVVGPDTTALLDGEPAHSTTAHYARCGVTFTLPQPLAPRIAWSQWGGRVAVSVWGGLRVDVFDEGRPALSVRSDQAAEPLDRDGAVALLEAAGYRGPCDADPAEAVDKHGFHPRPQIVREVAVAPDGWLWFRTVTEEGSRLRVHDAGGRPAGVLPDGFPMPLAFLPDGRLLVQVVDSMDVERIGVVAVKR